MQRSEHIQVHLCILNRNAPGGPRQNADKENHMQPDLEQLQKLVRRAAREELLPRFERVGHEVKADGSILTEADLAMDRRLHDELTALWPDIGFLSEEMETADQEHMLGTSDQLWCLDPLDGTSNFAAGVPYFGVSLALIRAGEPDIGLIYDPVRDESFIAARGKGAQCNGKPLQARASATPLQRSIALVDFKRLQPRLRERLMHEPPFHSQRNFGSCALEWAWMAAGRGHVYLHGGQKLWDFAAGCLLLSEAGGHSATLEGESVFRARMQPRSVVSAGDRALFDAWCAWLKDS